MTAAARPDRPDAALDLFHGTRLLVPFLAAAAAVSALVFDGDSYGVESVVAVAAVIPFVLWAWRPSFGALPLAVVTVVAVVVALRGGDLEPTAFMLSCAAVVAGSFEDSRGRLAIESVLLVGAPWFVWVVFFDDFFAGIWTLGILLPLLLTRSDRRQQLLAHELTEARAELADQRVLEERRRIARDVHDSVGHGLAAVLLHITAARHVVRRDPDDADASLAEAEAVGRRSMLELRDTLGLLRTGDRSGQAEPSSPVPDASSLADLGVEIIGDVDRLDPQVGRTLHRVAEEAFANARRHAPDASTSAHLDVGAERAVLTIESCGPRRPPTPEDAHRPRYGIVGMSERMAAIGGALDAGPTDSGWVVRASVPVTGRPVADR